MVNARRQAGPDLRAGRSMRQVRKAMAVLGRAALRSAPTVGYADG